MKRDRLSHISDIIDVSLSNLSLKDRLLEYKLQLAWPKIVGSAITKRTSPVKLTRGKLYVNVSSQTWMTELLYQKGEIIERISREVSEGLVADIIFRPGKITRAPQKKKAPEKTPEPFGTGTTFTSAFIDDTVAPVKDKELRELIRRTMSKGGG